MQLIAICTAEQVRALSSNLEAHRGMGGESRCWLPQPQGEGGAGGSQRWDVGSAGLTVHKESVKNQASPLGAGERETRSWQKAGFSPQQTPTGCPRSCLKSMQIWDQKPCVLALHSLKQSLSWGFLCVCDLLREQEKTGKEESRPRCHFRQGLA